MQLVRRMSCTRSSDRGLICHDWVWWRPKYYLSSYPKLPMREWSSIWHISPPRSTYRWPRYVVSWSADTTWSWPSATFRWILMTSETLVPNSVWLQTGKSDTINSIGRWAGTMMVGRNQRVSPRWKHKERADQNDLRYSRRWDSHRRSGTSCRDASGKWRGEKNRPIESKVKNFIDIYIFVIIIQN